MDLIRLEDLSVYYGSFRAFQAKHVRLPAGSIGLLGPNGAGKSTLIKVVLGLLRPRTGRGTVLGLDLHERSAEIRARVGYMPENESFVPGLTAVQFVTMAGELAGMPPRDAMRRAHEVLTYLGLEEARYRRIEEYSAGMKQRFKLAQALVSDPDLLVLDEPTNGLDPGGRRAMLGLVRSLHREFGKPIILATHLLEDVERVCDHLLVLNEGSVVAHGAIDDLRAHWHNRYRLRLERGAAAVLDGIERAGGRVLARPETGERDGEFVVELPSSWRGRHVFELAASLDGEVLLRSFRPDRERLGQLFRRILTARGVGDEAAPLAPVGTTRDDTAIPDLAAPVREESEGEVPLGDSRP